MTLTLILVRWMHLSASILMAGLFVFETAILLPVVRTTSAGNGDLLDTIHRVTCRAALWTLLAACVSWFVWSWLVASAMSGDDLIECFQSGDWLIVLTGTHFGHIWLFRAIVSLVSGLILWSVRQRPGRECIPTRILAALSLVELLSLAWVGHAAASPGAFGIVHLLGSALHLGASAFWPGALAPLTACLLLLINSSQVETIMLATPIVRRFSASSLIAAAVMALTGLLNSIFMIANFQGLLTSAYGRILVAKLILFFGMIGFGAWNLFLLKPRIAADVPLARLPGKSPLRLLLRNVLWEIGLGTLVVLIVGLLGITSPPAR